MLEIQEKINYGAGRILHHRRCPQLYYPMMELLHQQLCRHADALRCGEYSGLLFLVLRKIALAEEVAKQAVVFVMMTLFNVTDALQTVVVGINRLMMHMQRRQHYHW